MIRVAHFSDLHYAGATLSEVHRCFSFAVATAIARGVDCAVISGDSTDHALELHTPAVQALARRLQQLAAHCPVLLLQGTYSHEPPGTLDLFRLLSTRHPIHVADRIEQVALMRAGEWLASGGWRFDSLPEEAGVVFSCLPSVNKADVAAAIDAANAAEAVGEAIASLLRGWGVVNRRARLAGLPTVAVSHGTVLGCFTEHGVPMAGLDHEFTTSSLFSAEVSAFMLGHIHKHQVWRDGTRLVAYPGSIGRLHYGEEGDKGFLLWSVDANGAGLEFVPTPARRMVHIDFDAKPDMEVVRIAAAQAQGAYVRVRWCFPEEESGTVDRAAIVAELAGAAEVKLEGRVVPVVRSRAGGISREHSLPEKVRRWAEATGVDGGGLLARLERMEAAEVEQIVAEIARGESGAIVPEHGSQECPVDDALATAELPR
ncbi:MAG: metallophosphoesterase family protein [Proteobacteria bacterium]|nr:metallophosphoesterase family protein [Pseudomonadota bacterium]